MKLNARTGSIARFAFSATFAIMLCVGYAPQVSLAAGAPDPATPGKGFAGAVNGGLKSAAGDTFIGGEDKLPVIAGKIITSLIGLLGVILLGYLLYGGFVWMTAAGDKNKVDEAQKVIKNAIIGLVIIALSYAISTFVVEQLGTALDKAGTT